MDAFVIGVGFHAPAFAIKERRLEEMVYHTACAALADAGVTRGELDSVTLGACDELDGRSISSMLMAMPAGAYLTDEIKVTDSGATALCLATARIKSEEFDLCMVASWCKSSKTDVETVMRLRAEPFYTRPLGLGMVATDALFAQAMQEGFGIEEAEANERTEQSYQRARANPRGMAQAPPGVQAIAASPYEATPLRALQRAPLTDGAVCMVIASSRWLARNRDHRPLARIAGVGWASDSYRLGAERLRAMNSARRAWNDALRMAQLSPSDIDVCEIEAQTGWHEAGYLRAFGLEGAEISPSGGPFAQNPLFCTGLVLAGEAVLQVAGRAGPVQKPARVAAAHSCHGYAQQGNVVMVFASPEVGHG